MLLHPGRGEAPRRTLPSIRCISGFRSAERNATPRESVHNRDIHKETTLALGMRCGARQREPRCLPGRPFAQRRGEARCFGIYQSAGVAHLWDVPCTTIPTRRLWRRAGSAHATARSSGCGFGSRCRAGRHWQRTARASCTRPAIAARQHDVSRACRAAASRHRRSACSARLLADLRQHNGDTTPIRAVRRGCAARSRTVSKFRTPPLAATPQAPIGNLASSTIRSWLRLHDVACFVCRQALHCRRDRKRWSVHATASNRTSRRLITSYTIRAKRALGPARGLTEVDLSAR